MKGEGSIYMPSTADTHIQFGLDLACADISESISEDPELEDVPGLENCALMSYKTVPPHHEHKEKISCQACKETELYKAI